LRMGSPEGENSSLRGRRLRLRVECRTKPVAALRVAHRNGRQICKMFNSRQSQFCRSSSVAEQRFRKAWVVGSNPAFIDFGRGDMAAFFRGFGLFFNRDF